MEPVPIPPKSVMTPQNVPVQNPLAEKSQPPLQPQPQPQYAMPALCPQCHQPVQPEWYFCANCGTNLRKPPLSTTISNQILIYLFSAVLPWIAYLAITKWPGMKYIRSGDPQARAIGWIALGVLVVSSVVAFWLTTVWINHQFNTAMNAVGGLGGGLSGSGGGGGLGSLGL